MERYENTGMEVTTTEEVLVTNTAIKATDILGAVAAGALAIAGIGAIFNVRRKKKILEEQANFKERIIADLIREGASEEEIENATKLLTKYM